MYEYFKQGIPAREFLLLNTNLTVQAKLNQLLVSCPGIPDPKTIYVHSEIDKQMYLSTAIKH